MKQILMDSSDFEKIFDVNTTDKIQSMRTMRILTSDVMQKLIDFKNRNKNGRQKPSIFV